MKNSDFARQLEIRTKNFTLRIIETSSKFPQTPAAKVVSYQLLKSASSIGANYREANRARSRADFKNKIGICESEASETVYWIEIIIESKTINNKEMQYLLSEAKQILAIFTTIGKNTAI